LAKMRRKYPPIHMTHPAIRHLFPNNGKGFRTSARFSTSSGTTTTNHYLDNQSMTLPEMLTDSVNVYIYSCTNTPFEQLNLTTEITTYLTTDATRSRSSFCNSDLSYPIQQVPLQSSALEHFRFDTIQLINAFYMQLY